MNKELVDFRTKRLRKEITKREKEIIRLKILCLSNNPEYKRVTEGWHEHRDDLSDVEKMLTARNFAFEFGISLPVRPVNLKSLLKNPNWVSLKGFFYDLLPYNIKVLKAPYDDEDLDEQIFEYKGAFPDPKKRPDLVKMKEEMKEYEKLKTDITVKINLLGNKKKVLEEIELVLKKYLKRAPPEVDLKYCERCLNTYIAKETTQKSGRKLTFEELAQKLYPRKDGPTGAVLTQVKREYKKGKLLVMEKHLQLK